MSDLVGDEVFIKREFVLGDSVRQYFAGFFRSPQVNRFAERNQDGIRKVLIDRATRNQIRYSVKGQAGSFDCGSRGGNPARPALKERSSVSISKSDRLNARFLKLNKD